MSGKYAIPFYEYRAVVGFAFRRHRLVVKWDVGQLWSNEQIDQHNSFWSNAREWCRTELKWPGAYVDKERGRIDFYRKADAMLFKLTQA